MSMILSVLFSAHRGGCGTVGSADDHNWNLLSLRHADLR